MPDSHPAPTVVVGVDGSPAARGAAVWAVDEAASRDIPLKLVYVIHPAGLPGSAAGDAEPASARAALSDARHAVEATGTPVKIETQAVRGNPLATLIELSRSAVLVCVGSIGLAHSCHRAGSTAAALSGSAGCPVAVIHSPDIGARPATVGRIVAEVDASPDNNAVLGWAMTEARLRAAPLRVIMAVTSAAGEADSSVRAQRNRRIDRWTRQYPDVRVESVVVHGGATEYLSDNADSVKPVQLFVSGTRDLRSLGRPGDTGGSSVLTVGGTRL